MTRRRARVAVVAGDLSLADLARACTRAPELHGHDLVLIGRGAASVAAARGLPLVASGGALGESFETARRGGEPVALLDSERPLDGAWDLARAGLVDGIAGASSPDDVATLERLAGTKVAALLVRGDRRIVPLASGPRRALARELDPARVRRLVELASSALARDHGLARPRLALCGFDPDGDEDEGLLAAAREARSAGLDLVGPLAAEDAFARPGIAAVVTATRDQERLGLLLERGGITTRSLLGTPFPCATEDPRDARTDARAACVRASVLATAEVAARRGELVAERLEREAQEKRARAASVAVAVRRAVDRCPYCRRGFDDDEPEVRCARCETPHHRACIHEHGRCTVHGCASDSVVRGGIAIPIARLGGEDSQRHPFHDREGTETRAGLEWLVVEAPIDDPQASPRAREVVLELDAPAASRGGRVAGALVVRAPKAFHASGALLSVRATLAVRDPSDERPAAHPILDREAVVFGRPRGLLGRLSDGLASLLGTTELVAIPAGVRRWHFSFRLGVDHPVTVRHARGATEEVVATTLEATLLAAGGGTLSTGLDLVVR